MAAPPGGKTKSGLAGLTFFGVGLRGMLALALAPNLILTPLPYLTPLVLAYSGETFLYVTFLSVTHCFMRALSKICLSSQSGSS